MSDQTEHAPEELDDLVEEEEGIDFGALADAAAEDSLSDEIHARHLAMGKELLSDSLPSELDGRIAERLEGFLGDVSDVRVHTGKAATEAARAMDARAFAIGDGDIFVDEAEYDPHSTEGGALLAHEVAHTRDAATGFALSARRGSSADPEEFAHEVEREFAREDEAVEASPRPETPAVEASAPISAMESEQPLVDQVKLTERVVEILNERDRKDRERSGL